MDVFDLLHRGVFWLVLVIYCVGLYVAISWPRIKGKAWLVVSLTLLVIDGLYFRILEAVIHLSADPPRFELYKRLEAVSFVVTLSMAGAYTCLVVALFQLRSFLNTSGMLATTNTNQQALSNAAVRTTWPARGGTFIGAYRPEGSTSVALARSASLSCLEDNSVMLNAKYDPPGTLFYAFLATILAGVVFVVMLKALGFAAAPGWLVWYVIILLIRRRRVTFNLANAQAIVVDANTSRVAFHTQYDGRDRWFAVQVLSGFGDVFQALKVAAPGKVRDGKVASPSLLPIILLLAFILAIPVVVALLIFLSQR